MQANDLIVENEENSTFKLPSVFKGEVAFLTFSVEGKEIGKLWAKGGKLSFEGDCEKSAKIFFDEVIQKNRHLLEMDEKAK